MNIEVVHHEMNCRGLAVSTCQKLKCIGEIRGRPPLRHAHIVTATARFGHHEDIRGAAAAIFRISQQHTVASTADGPNVSSQLNHFFVKTDDGLACIVRSLVDFHDVQEPRAIVLIDGRDAPHFFPATASSRPALRCASPSSDCSPSRRPTRGSSTAPCHAAARCRRAR